MQQLIPMINEIQEIMAQSNSPMMVDLPQIVVIGAQSTGKSSVLESIVGKDFLPRGEGIVTRRPLILQLNHTKEGTDYGTFKHNPAKKFENYKEIKQEIEADTRKVAGNTKNISEEPIILNIYSPNVPNLTLVDLPGMTKVPIGDQPKDIEAKVRELVHSYAKNKNAVILAVSSANTDLANSDSLKLAREVDPEGARTLGVLTKLDIMDKGTNALEMLSNKVYSLALGYIGVVCRSQKDINENSSIEAALKSEKDFFDKHPAYRHLKEGIGIPYLSKTLSNLLKSHIQKSLPELKVGLEKMIEEKKKELENYGEDYKEKYKGSLDTLVLHIVKKYNEAFRQSLSGFIRKGAEQLLGGARILNICVNSYEKMLDEIDLFEQLSDKIILHAIMNARGLRAYPFLPDAAFEMLIKEKIKEFVEPSLKCLNIVTSELHKITSGLLPEYQRYEPLRRAILSLVRKLIDAKKKETEKEIRSAIKVEKCFINMNHPDFKCALDAYRREADDKKIAKALETTPEIGSQEPKLSLLSESMVAFPSAGRYAPSAAVSKKAGTKLEPASKLSASKPMAEEQKENYSTITCEEAKMEATIQDLPNQEEDMNLIKKMLLEYYSLVKKILKDKIPKIIIHFMIKKLKKECEDELTKKIYREGNANELLEERQEQVLKRNSCIQALDALNRSLEVICKYAS